MKIIYNGETVTAFELKKMTDSYKRTIEDFYSEHPQQSCRKIGISVPDPVSWIAAAFAVFQSGAVLCPVDSTAGKLLREREAALFEPDMIIAEERTAGACEDQGGAADFRAGDFFVDMEGRAVKIHGSRIEGWMDFNRETLKLHGKKAVVVIGSETDLAGMMWIHACLNYDEIVIINEIRQIEDADAWFMPERYICELVEKGWLQQCSAVTFGEEEVMLEEVRDFLVAANVQWYNYFGFPDKLWLSACREILVTGEAVKAHEIRPTDGEKLCIENEDGGRQGSRIPGIVACGSAEGSGTGIYRGILQEDGRIYVLGRRTPGVYCNGVYVRRCEIEDSLLDMDIVADFAVEGKSVYYSEKDITPPKLLEAGLKERLPAQLFPLDFYKVPYIPRERSGAADIRRLSAMAVKADFDIRDISGETDELHCAVNVAFENRDQGMAEFERCLAPETGVEQSSEDAVVDRGTLSYEDLCAASLTELLKLRKNSSQKLIYVDDSGEREQTYSQLYDRARLIAGSLRSMGLVPGSKLVLQLTDNKAYIEAFWGCMLAGIVPAPLAVLDDYGTTNLNTDKLQNICRLLENPFILTSEGLRPAIEKLYGAVICFEDLEGGEPIAESDMYDWGWEETTLLLFTSGSTGLPKGVMLTQKNIFARTLGEIALYGFDKTLVDVNWMTLTHAAGLVWTNVRDIYLDCFQVQVKPEYILGEPLEWIELLSRYRANVTWAPNFAFSMINEEADDDVHYDWDLSELKYVFATAEANVSKTLRGFLKKLRPYGLPQDAVKPCFGMTETASVNIYYDGFAYDTTSDNDEFVPIGTPVEGHAFRIVDDEGNVCRKGQTGHIQERGDTVMPGYYENPEVNAESFTPDGYFITGDLGYIEGDVVTLTGREKDIIIINGLNYYVQDIESVVDELPEVHASYTVATSVQNSKSEEEILILFTPQDEDIMEDNGALHSLTGAIKRAVREKCNIFPTYVIPVPSGRSIRTELGKKQRNKYRQAFYRGEYDDMIQQLGMGKRTSQSVLVETWYPQPVKGIIEENTPCSAITESESSVPEEILDMIPQELRIEFDGADTPTAETEVLVDFLALEADGDSVSVEDFAVKAAAHARMWAKQQKVRRIIVPAKHMHMLEGDIAWDKKCGVLRGLIKSFNIEFPEKRCRTVDFDEIDTKLLMDEICCRDTEEETAYRRGLRYAAYFRTAEPAADKTEDDDWNGRLCMITGGMGGIGRNLAQHLVRNYDMDLILTGRSALDDEKKLWMEEMKEFSGRILYVESDVSDYEELKRAVTQGEDELGRKATLFFHLAGQISASEDDTDHWSNFEEHRILNESDHSILQVMAGKAAGTENICRIADEREGSQTYVFGSVNGYFGGASLASYSMGNSFAEAYCRFRNSAGRNVRCFNWSNWKETGISARIPDAVIKASARSGFESAETQDYIGYLETLRHYDLPDVWIGVDIHSRNYQSRIVGEYEKVLDIFYTEALSQESKERIAARADHDVKIQYRKVKSIPVTGGTEGYTDFKTLYRDALSIEGAGNNEVMSDEMKQLSEIWKDVLKVSSVAPGDDFFDLGGNSILISKLSIRIMKHFDVNISFQDLLENSTLRALAEKIASGRQEKGQLAFTTDKNVIEEDAVLRVPVESMLRKTAEYDDEGSIMLTGVTGFLGAFISVSLLKHTDRNIVLMVRAEDREKAAARVAQTLSTYGLGEFSRSSRFEFICGDITKDQFGLKAEEYRELAAKVSTVYHSAADVNFVSPYRNVAETNVDGTRRILRFAATERRKSVHHISSYVVYYAPEKQERPLDERSRLTLEQPLGNAYNETKWAADAMCGQAAEEGLECVRYRIGTATGDTGGGHCQIRDFFWILIKICLRLRKVPLVDMRFNLIPVDIMADAIVGLSMKPYRTGEDAYTLGFDDISIDAVVGWLRTIDEDMECTSYELWIEALRKYAENTQDTAILSALSVFTDRIEWEEPEVDDSHTADTMKALGLTRQTMDLDNFTRTYGYLERTGFFD